MNILWLWIVNLTPSEIRDWFSALFQGNQRFISPDFWGSPFGSRGRWTGHYVSSLFDGSNNPARPHGMSDQTKTWVHYQPTFAWLRMVGKKHSYKHLSHMAVAMILIFTWMNYHTLPTNISTKERGISPLNLSSFPDAFPPKKSQRNPPNLRLNQVPEDLLVEKKQLEQHTHALVKLP